MREREREREREEEREREKEERFVYASVASPWPENTLAKSHTETAQVNDTRACPPVADVARRFVSGAVFRRRQRARGLLGQRRGWGLGVPLRSSAEVEAWAYNRALQLKGQSTSPANQADSPCAAVQQQPACKSPKGGVATTQEAVPCRWRVDPKLGALRKQQRLLITFRHVHDHASVTSGREALLLNTHVNATQVQSPTQVHQTYSSQFANHQRLTVNLGLGVVDAASTPLLSSHQPLGHSSVSAAMPSG